MAKKRILFICFLISLPIWGQKTPFFQKEDLFNKKRFIAINASIGLAASSSLIGLYSVWYQKDNASSFHIFNDSKNWLQMDKAGHVYTAYQLSKLNSDLYSWSGLKYKSAAITGSTIAFAYQSTLEVFDGLSKNWGFSWSDCAANAFGISLYLSQQLKWKEQKILLKFSYHPTNYANIRPNILGSNFQERLLKDYNGQSYWITFSPALFFHQKKFPKWACLSLGYSVDEKLVGDKEHYTNTVENIIYDYHSKREFLLSLDIDFSKIPIKRLWLKTLVSQINYLKIPFPSLLLQKNKLIFAPIYF